MPGPTRACDRGPKKKNKSTTISVTSVIIIVSVWNIKSSLTDPNGYIICIIQYSKCAEFELDAENSINQSIILLICILGWFITIETEN